MKRVLVSVALLAFAAWLCVVGRPSAASDDPLTPAMRKQIDASLVVFVGEITESHRRDARWDVSYKIERFLKGTCFEPELEVQHVAERGREPSAPAVDPGTFALGRLVIVGAQFRSERWSGCGLRCAGEELAPMEWTQATEDAVLRQVAEAPRGPVAPTAEARARRNLVTCSNNMSQLGQVYLMNAQENRAKAQKHSGPALWLAMRKNAAFIRRGEERVLLCPCDQAARRAPSDTEGKPWDDVDLAHPAPGLCSYVGRDFVDFPPTWEDHKPEAIGACLHHPGGAVVVFDSGDVRFMSLAELGLASDTEKSVGPDSKSPLLRKLR